MPLLHFCFLTNLFFSIFSLILTFPLFFLIFRFFSFLLFFSLVFSYSFWLPFFSSSFCLHCAQLRPIYTTCHNEFYCFTPQLLLACVGVLLRPPTGLSAAQPSLLSCASHATFHSQTKEFCFLALRGIPIQIRTGYSFLLTPIACT